MKRIIFTVFFLLLLFSCERKAEDGASIELPESIEEENPPARADRSGSAEIAFFYLETCPTCDSYLRAEELSANIRQAAEKGYFPWRKVTFLSNNVLTKEQADLLQQYVESYGQNRSGLEMPVIFINDTVVVGYEEIEKLIQGLTEF